MITISGFKKLISKKGLAIDDKHKKRLDQIQVEVERIPKGSLTEYFEIIARHSYSARLDAHHSTRSIFQGNSCSKTWLIVLSGRDKTDSAGEAKILIDPLLCGVTREGFPFGEGLVMMREPHFVATPHATAPVFVTVQTSSTTQPPQPGTLLLDRDENVIYQSSIFDLEVKITSWKHDGTPAANTTFSWICTIEAARAKTFG